MSEPITADDTGIGCAVFFAILLLMIGVATIWGFGMSFVVGGASLLLFLLAFYVRR